MRQPVLLPRLVLALPARSLAALRSGFRQDFGEERSTLLVPQVWFSLPREATLKLGAGFDLDGGNHQNFARVVFEIEF